MKRPITKSYLVATLLAGLGVQIVVLQAFGTFGGGSPTELAPAPFPLALLYFMGLGPFALGIPVVAFWAWGFPLFSGSAQLPTRTIVLVLASVVGSALWLVLGDARHYYDWRLFSISGASVICIAAVVVWCRSRPSFFANALGHALVFGWLGSFAFPWIGEVP